MTAAIAAIQTIAPPDTQLRLFDLHRVINCDSCASARNAYGDAAQEIVYRLLGVTPIRINGNFSTCFDGVQDGVYCEIKSTNAVGGKVVVYDWRMGKEAASGVPLRYLIVYHGLRGHRDDILQAIADREVVIYSIPSPVIHAAALECPLHKITREQAYPREGYTRDGYRDGYRNVPLSHLAKRFEFAEKTIQNTIGAGRVVLRTCGPTMGKG